jgi:tRNA dimethylallyltransferase
MSVEVVAIFGPTAAGKTAVAEALADLLGTEIVSADAMQVYRGLPLLTNQPSRPTCLVGIRELDEEMSVGEYARLAHVEIDRLVAILGVAIVAGGTGLYLRAAIADLRLPSPPAAGARATWEAFYDADPAAAHATLTTLDVVAAGRVHVNDRRRVVRALELAEVGESLAPSHDRLWAGEPRRPTVVFGLDVEREELERRIATRTAAMFDDGVEGEVRAALRHGVSPSAQQALGLREIAELPADEARARVVARTRRYAAYQRKWMRRIPGISLLDGTRPSDELAHEIVARVVQ